VAQRCSATRPTTSPATARARGQVASHNLAAHGSGPTVSGTRAGTAARPEPSLQGSPASSRGATMRKVDGGVGAAGRDLHKKRREVRQPAIGARGGGREVSTVAKAERKRWRGALTRAEAVKRGRAATGRGAL
jgi:hypothetical protein